MLLRATEDREKAVAEKSKVTTECGTLQVELRHEVCKVLSVPTQVQRVAAARSRDSAQASGQKAEPTLVQRVVPARSRDCSQVLQRGCREAAPKQLMAEDGDGGNGGRAVR